MKVFFVKVAALMALSFLVAAGASYAEGGPTVLSGGEALFNAKCSVCHGIKGAGTEMGPPLVHRIYHPNHHADFSFRRAVSLGVRAHHWPFGDMDKVEGVSADDVELIIKYVRSIQHEAGIF
jgi:mono/diheme cytochrome c family protein